MGGRNRRETGVQGPRAGHATYIQSEGNQGVKDLCPLP